MDPERDGQGCNPCSGTHCLSDSVQVIFLLKAQEQQFCLKEMMIQGLAPSRCSKLRLLLAITIIPLLRAALEPT